MSTRRQSLGGPVPNPNDANQTVRRASHLALVSAFARLPGFLIPVVIAAFFGVNAGTDAYFLAYSAVLLVGGTLAQVVELVIVPFAAATRDRALGTLPTYLDRAARTCAGVTAIVWMGALGVLAAVSEAAIRGEVLRYALALTPLVV